MVFHTAPPQPASKARRTWSPQLAGGPEASQNGLGEWILPANLMLRSAIFALQPIGDADRGALSSGHGIDHFASAVDTIASRKIPRVSTLPRLGVGRHFAILRFDATTGEKIHQFRLADRHDEGIAGHGEVRSRDRNEPGVQPHALESLDSRGAQGLHGL